MFSKQTYEKDEDLNVSADDKNDALIEKLEKETKINFEKKD